MQWFFMVVDIGPSTVRPSVARHMVVSRKLSKIDPQGAYNSGKHGNLREFVHSGKLRENSGNLKFTQGIYQMLFFCDAICLSGIELCA